MAFTKDQKNQLALMVENPKEFLQKCKEGKIYLPGFKDEYFKDGTGILHLLSVGLINKSWNLDYLKLFEYILEQDTKISIFDYSGRKDSTFQVLKDAAKDHPQLCPVITQLLLKQKNVKSNESYESNSYSIRSFVTLLGEKGYVSEINQVLEKFPYIAKIPSLHQSLLKSAIEFKKNDVLDYILSNKIISEILDNEIGTFHFNSSKPYNESRYGNIYSYCISCGNHDALFKLIDRFGDKINYDGTFVQKDRYYNPNSMLKDAHPLETILKGENKELFEKYYRAIPIEQRTEWLSTDHNRRINTLYKRSWHEVVLNDLENIFTSETVKNRDKLSIYNQLLYFSKDTIDSEKYQNIEKIITPVWDIIPAVNEATSFNGCKSLFDNFYSKGDMSDAEINSFVNIFKKIKERGELLASGRMFSNSFFNEPQLVKKLLDVGLPIDVIPTHKYLDEGIKEYSFNIYEHYLHNFEQQKKNPSVQKIDALNFERVKETLNVLYQKNHELAFNKTAKDKSVLCIAMEQNSREIFELLTVEDFKKFKELDAENILKTIDKSYSPSKEYKDKFTICLDKLLKAGFLDRQENDEVSQMFYYFIDKTDDFSLLDKIYENAKIDLNQEIQKQLFWYCMNTENPALYLKPRITKNIEQENVAQILRVLSYSDHYRAQLENLLDVFPEVHKTKLIDGDNILHNAIKEKAYDSAKWIVEHFPDLAIEANKQNKMPISYVIAIFAKDIEKNKDKYSFKESIKKHASLFDSLINCGLASPNKKANAFLEEQLEKYSIIKETFPEAIKTYEYQKLNRALHKNNAPSGKKLKI